MTGLRWCISCVAAGIALALLGLWLNWEPLMVLGGGLIALVIVGWPALVLMGELNDLFDRKRPPRR